MVEQSTRQDSNLRSAGCGPAALAAELLIVAHPEGFEPPPSCFVGKRSYPLCYGRMMVTEGVEPPASVSSGRRSAAQLRPHSSGARIRTSIASLTGKRPAVERHRNGGGIRFARRRRIMSLVRGTVLLHHTAVTPQGVEPCSTA